MHGVSGPVWFMFWLGLLGLKTFMFLICLTLREVLGTYPHPHLFDCIDREVMPSDRMEKESHLSKEVIVTQPLDLRYPV